MTLERERSPARKPVSREVARSGPYIADILTVTSFAAAIGKSEQTVRRYIKQGRVHSVSYQNSVRIPRRELHKFPHSHVPVPNPDKSQPWNVFSFLLKEGLHLAFSLVVGEVLG